MNKFSRLLTFIESEDYSIEEKINGISEYLGVKGYGIASRNSALWLNSLVQYLKSIRN